MPYLTIQFIRKLFAVPALPDADWEQLRLGLLRRSLLVLLPVNTLYAIVTGLLGHPVLPALLGLGVSAAVLYLLLRHPAWRRPLVWVLAFCITAALFFSVRLWQHPQPAPALLIAALIGSLALMLDGLALGLAAFTLNLGVAVLAAALLPPGDSKGLLIIVMLTGLNIVLFSVSLGWYHGLQAGKRALERASRLLLKQRDERQVLSLALFHELSQAQQRVDAAVGQDGPLDWARALDAAERMQGRALEIRQLRNSFDADEPSGPPAELEFDRGVVQAIMGVSLVMTSVGGLLRLITDAPGLWHTLLVLPVFGFGLFALRGGRPVRPWLAWTPVLVSVAVLCGDTLQQWGRALPVINGFWCMAILVAGLLLGWRVALGTAVAGALVVAAATAALPAGEARAAGLQFAAVLYFGFCMVVAICLQGLVWERNVIQLQEAGRRQLASGLAQRRRLLGTLFHDAANPLMALLGLCDQGRAGLSQPGDEARVRRLVRRLGELLQDSQGWLMAEDPHEQPGLGRVDLEPVLAGVADLFQERLAAKRLGLNLETEAGLHVQAQAAVLRDSVLGNLMSNAIKFSRAGSSLELEAHSHGGEASIELRDRGPGLAPELVRALERGEDLPSQAGTGGEGGQGLGLALAREHLQRMGGRLEIFAREGGGTVARLWLKAS